MYMLLHKADSYTLSFFFFLPWHAESCLLFVSLFLLAMPQGMWDLSFSSSDGTRDPCSGSREFQPLDHQRSPPPCGFNS